MEARISVLESQLARITEESDAVIASRDSEIRRLRAQLAEQLMEYQDLMDLKLKLDNEIEAYRKLLESEEHRYGTALGFIALRIFAITIKIQWKCLFAVIQILYDMEFGLI